MVMGINEPDDRELLRRVADGEEAALRVLFERHARWLQLRLARRCGDPDLVASALQDTFVAAWTGAGRYRGDGDVGAWLWGIAVRRLVSGLRHKRPPVPMSIDMLARVFPAAENVEDQLLLAVEHSDVGTALRRLSPELRAVIQATVLDGLTTREAAALLGLPAGTVKSRLRAARCQLRGQLVQFPEGGRP